MRGAWLPPRGAAFSESSVSPLIVSMAPHLKVIFSPHFVVHVVSQQLPHNHLHPRVHYSNHPPEGSQSALE
jgi:hypothetical protein